jgi:hypothetical protein
MELIHFARAERLDVFRDLLVGNDCWTTRVVLEEARRGPRQSLALRAEDADWLSIAELDTYEGRAGTWFGCAWNHLAACQFLP